MRILAFVAGVVCLFIVLLDAFETIILPRRAVGRFRLTRLFYIATWTPWVFVVKRFRNPRRRESAFSFYGPLSLIFLLVVWAGSMTIGFALLFFALGSPVIDAHQAAGLKSDLYVSGTTIFTLGLGDVIPRNDWARALVILESGTGLGFLAVVMGYFPVLYSAFSRREVSISLLDARAGSPPTAAELLRRHACKSAEEALSMLLMEWERWSAELLESHISYPQLCYFRSQHTNQSWLAALTAILDTSALLVAGAKSERTRQAELTFAMARHAVVDLAQIFSLKPINDAPDRLPFDRYQQVYGVLMESGVNACGDGQCVDRLREMRLLYEGYAEALSRYLRMPLPPWIAERPFKDNWQTVARVRTEADRAIAATSGQNEGKPAGALIPPDIHHHDF
jgi:hypothetical protein